MRPRHTKATPRKRRASTQDVLGRAAETEEIRPKLRKHYQRLMELRQATLQRQSAASREALEEQPFFSSHMADAATDTYDRDFALTVLSAEQNALYEIDEALARIRNGRYGICELTGKPIEAARLETIPWTRFTAEAEKRLESAGAVDRTRLGERQAVERTAVAAESEEEEEG